MMGQTVRTHSLPFFVLEAKQDELRTPNTLLQKQATNLTRHCDFVVRFLPFSSREFPLLH